MSDDATATRVMLLGIQLTLLGIAGAVVTASTALAGTFVFAGTAAVAAGAARGWSG
ncbi:MAG: hypothetical protein ABEJ43_08900 [Haloferacaceae archaeon]